MTQLPALPPSRLIGHRGWPLHYPENSIAGFRAALDRGALMVECDVQLSADECPHVIHDAKLRRTAGIGGSVLEQDSEQIARVEVNESKRLDHAFRHVHVPTLQAFVELMIAFPAATCFVELKRASIRRFGARRVLDRVLPLLQPVAARCVLISTVGDILSQARAAGTSCIGWVMKPWNKAALRTLRNLAPEYVFCAVKRIPHGAGVFVRGPWRWVVYSPNTVDDARSFIDRGADLVETDAIGELMADPRLHPGDGSGP